MKRCPYPFGTEGWLAAGFAEEHGPGIFEVGRQGRLSDPCLGIVDLARRSAVSAQEPEACIAALLDGESECVLAFSLTSRDEDWEEKAIRLVHPSVLCPGS